MSDLISRQAAILHFVKASKNYECGMFDLKELTHELWQVPSAQPDLQPTCNQLASDCISRQAAIDALYEQDKVTPMTEDCLEMLLDRFEALPSAQPKKGKWEQIEINYFADMENDIKESMAMASMYCPICKRYHNEVYLYGDPTYGVNYCPNCGADMRGDNDV